VDPVSFQNVKKEILHELKQHAQGVPILVVGLQTELRQNIETLEKLEAKFLEPVSMKEV
jgi:cell division control protein 42